MPLKKKTISVIFGTRPEAIKLAPIILLLKENKLFNCQVCITGQHREMLDQVLEVFNIIPNHDLNLMIPNQTLTSLTSSLLISIDNYLKEQKPDLIIVQGDTTSVFTAALAAFYNKIPIAHVEAGLRTHNIYSPWPEEGNRKLTSSLAKFHFAPTVKSKNNLLIEGIAKNKIFVTGNTVISALYIAKKIIKNKHVEIPGISESLLNSKKKIVLITAHRRESFGGGFESICNGIIKLSNHFKNVEFIYPVHLNPMVREPVERIIKLKGNKNIHLIEPLSYLPFIRLMDRSYLILTDSGGIQEEGPSLGKPVLVMRESTERPEGVDSGTVRLTGTDSNEIFNSTAEILEDKKEYDLISQIKNPYGDERSAENIVEIISNLI